MEVTLRRKGTMNRLDENAFCPKKVAQCYQRREVGHAMLGKRYIYMGYSHLYGESSWYSGIHFRHILVHFESVLG